jgi:hypothetical protein
MKRSEWWLTRLIMVVIVFVGIFFINSGLVWRSLAARASCV